MASVVTNLIDWLLGQSQALRGASVPVLSTCATIAEYQAAIQSGGTRARLLLRVSYPRPTCATVVLGGTLGSGQPNDSLFPRFYAKPQAAGMVVRAPYLFNLGAYWVEWIVGGAVQSALVDLGAGSLSLPAVDQVTIRFISLIAGTPPPNARFTCQVLPFASPGAQATCSTVPILVTAPVPGLLGTREQWATGWRVATASPGATGVSVPAPYGQAVIKVVDNVAGDTSEQYTFGDLLGTGGQLPYQSYWIGVGGFTASSPTAAAVDYIAHARTTPIECKLIERLQVG